MTPKIIRKPAGHVLMGGRQTIKLTAEDTDNKLAVIFSKVPAGSGIPPHVHSREDELFTIANGALEVTVDGTVHLLQEGDMICLPKNIPHSFKAITDTEMWVTLVPGGGEKMFVELAALPPGPPDMDTVSQISERYGIAFI